MLKLGILSDTHSYFHPALPDMLVGVDEILHAGDVGSLAVLEALQAIAPVTGVWGNIDGAALRRVLPEHQRIVREGCQIWMTHIGGRPHKWDKTVQSSLLAQPPDIFICGHSHILRIERVTSLNNMLFINPGAAGQQGWHQVKTCIRLTLDTGKAIQAEVVHL